MKKSFTISLILISSFLFSGCTTQNNNQSMSTSTNENQESSQESSLSLRDLIAQNIPQKCTYSGQNQNGSFESQIIINGEKFKQTTTMLSDGNQEVINSLSDGQYIYTWGKQSGNDFAMKMKADFNQSTPESEDSIEENMSSSQLDLDTDYQINCLPTTVSDSDFQPPKEVKFEDYSQFLEQMKSSIPIDVTNLE